MKICNSCGTEKYELEFGKRKASIDGLSPKCRSCQKVYDKARSGDEGRKHARELYAQTDEGRLAGSRAKALYIKRNPKKSKAHGILGRAVRGGKMKRLPCEICNDEKSIAHHDDYSFPLSVRWLCQAHHKQWHAKNGEGKNGK